MPLNTKHLFLISPELRNQFISISILISASRRQFAALAARLAQGCPPKLDGVSIMREYLPDLKIRVVNVVDLMKLQPRTEHPHGLSDMDFDELFTKDKPVIFAFHGYPWLIHRLTYRRTNHDNIHVRGYKEEGTITTPFDMTVLNDLDGTVTLPNRARNKSAGMLGSRRSDDVAPRLHRRGPEGSVRFCGGEMALDVEDTMGRGEDKVPSSLGNNRRSVPCPSQTTCADTIQPLIRIARSSR